MYEYFETDPDHPDFKLNIRKRKRPSRACRALRITGALVAGIGIGFWSSPVMVALTIGVLFSLYKLHCELVG